MSIILLGFIFIVFFVNLSFVLKRRFDYLFFMYTVLLPVYILGLSVVYSLSSDHLPVQVCQFSKEILLYIIPAFALIMSLSLGKAKFLVGKLDIWMFCYFCFVLLFLFIPTSGEFGVKIGAFRSLIALSFAYLCGRLTIFSSLQQKWIFYVLAIIAFLTGFIAIIEFLGQRSIHEFSGYSKLLDDFYNMPFSGHYGLTWTFETENGIRRFSSIFSDPLEYSASLLLILPSIVIILSDKVPGIKRYFLRLALIVGSIGLLLSVSRASIVAFIIQIIIIYYYVSSKRNFFLFLTALGICMLFFGILASDSIIEMINDTISFRNASSLGHLMEWIRAIESIISNPLGIGLGTSGNVAAQSNGEKIGGENQFLIIAVQIGLIGLALYLIILGIAIKSCLKIFKNRKGQMDGKLALLAGVVKIGLLLPLFTANVELYSFVSYISWWLVGYVTNISLSDEDRN